MAELDIFGKLQAIESETEALSYFDNDTELAKRIADHRVWLSRIRHERPSTTHDYKIGIYIRYYNQTKYTNYLSYHKKSFADTIALCPKWELVDFYVDEGINAPNMESAPEWSRLLNDCMSGKVDLIITQKVSNVSRKPYEIALCSRMLALQPHPVGIYFLSEDLFTLANYYAGDLQDTYFVQSSLSAAEITESSEKGGSLIEPS